MNLLKNLCRIRYRLAYFPESDTSASLSNQWVELDIIHTSTLEIKDELTDGGVVYTCTVKTDLQQEAVYEQQPLIVECTLSDGRSIQVGSSDFPAEMRSSENLESAGVEFECQTIYKPYFDFAQ
ncbi:MAG: hypothetical protein LBN27_12255 [Prevotellaceae bacterium]|jgi:hypothetical protein|nr:hypothetical protein [Prevotellaceae bacterium]